MKINMADNEYFPIGTILSCTLCNGRKVQGEVMAFDHTTKLLAIKSQCANAKSNLNDVHIVNLSLISDGGINVIKEATEPAPPCNNLHFPRIQQRLAQSLEEKCRKANYIGKDVTPLAQKVFHHITKTINEVRWDGQKIVVMDQVVISPPYESEQVTGKEGSQAIQHVKKLVDKYHRDESKRESSVSSNSSSS